MQPHYSHVLRELLEGVGEGGSSVGREVTVHFDHENEEEITSKVRFNTMEKMVKEYEDAYEQ